MRMIFLVFLLFLLDSIFPDSRPLMPAKVATSYKEGNLHYLQLIMLGIINSNCIPFYNRCIFRIYNHCFYAYYLYINYI